MSKRLRKILILVFSIFIIFLIILQFVLAPIIEKQGSKLTGRKVTLNTAFVNPLSGQVYLNGITCSEQGTDSLFFSAQKLTINLRMRSLLQGEFDLQELDLHEPTISIVQFKRDSFNFSGLIDKFSSGKKDSSRQKEKSHLNLGKISVHNATIRFRDVFTPVDFSLLSFDITAKMPERNSDTLNCSFAFKSGTGEGQADGYFNMNTAAGSYLTHFVFRRFDLGIIGQYLRDFSKNGKFKAMINADITARGNFSDAQQLEAKGGVGLYNFSFKKWDGTDFASFKKVVLKIDGISPAKKLYRLDSISVVEPFLHYEKYDKTDNVTVLFGKGNKNEEGVQEFNLAVEIARYMRLLAKNFFHSSYTINRLGIYRAEVKYTDYSLGQTFEAGVRQLSFTGDSLHSSKKRVQLRLHSAIAPYGKLNVGIGLNPADSSDFSLHYEASGISAAMFNPYLITYSSYPLNRGTISLRGDWNVINGNISSKNHLLIVDPRLADREKSRGRWLPMKLLLALTRERSNAIDYEIPVSGNLRDPHFHFRDVLLDVLTNVFVKPPTTLYRYEVREVEEEVENFLRISWKPLSAKLSDDDRKFAERMARFLSDHPEARLEVQPVVYMDLEMQYLSEYLSAKKYALQKGRWKGEDSLRLVQELRGDSDFVKAIDQFQHVYSTKQNMMRYAGLRQVHQHYRQLQEVRKQEFLSAFGEGTARNRVTFLKHKDRMPFNGFSEYRISYKGNIPEDLRTAFEELQHYNDRSPRDRFKRFRKPVVK